MDILSKDGIPGVRGLVAALPEGGVLAQPLGTPADGASNAAAVDAPRPAWLDRGRIPCLDGLRAISIAIVFVEHICATGGYIKAGGLWPAVGHMGMLGVDVFFTISGFLITLLLVREFERTDTICLKGFYTRRFLRLMPAMGVFLLTIFILHLFGQSDATGRNWLHMLTYTVNFDPHPRLGGHLWSLSIEEQFYFIWPLLLLSLGPRGGRTAAVVWLLAAPLLRFAVFRFHPHDMGRFDTWTPFRIDCIAAGCLLGLLAGDPRFRRMTRVGGRAAGLLTLAAAVVMVGGYLAGFRISIYEVTIGHSVRAVCIAAIIWLTINNTGSAWANLLETKAFVLVGVLSYSLYLWQQPFLAGDPDLDKFNLPVRVLGAVAAAVASYYVVELPFLRLKDRVSRKHVATA
jgi:peptidoglycan/LPS O-acetylase OafA/YrhL